MRIPSGMASISLPESLPSIHVKAAKLLFEPFGDRKTIGIQPLTEPAHRFRRRPVIRSAAVAPHEGRAETIAAHRDDLPQIGQVIGHNLDTQQAHLVGRLFAPAHPSRRLAGVGGVIRRVVV